MPLVVIEILPQPRDWQAAHGIWRGDVLEIDPALGPHMSVLASPDFALKADQLVTLTFSGSFDGGADYALNIVDSRRQRPVHSRLFEALGGDARMSLAFRLRKSGWYHLVLEHVGHPNGVTPTITAPSLVTRTLEAGAPIRGRLADLGKMASDGDTGRYLPHWNRVQRFIHRRCRASQNINNVVAAIEMRLGREEVLSLPQYMAVCPTGQCNALCDFCSVTINRTGIIKKQLPYERLESFLAPVANTIQLYGIEGNGEPTLYGHFPELVERLTRGRTQAYLITNGSRLQLSDVPLLLSLESVNFSLNAATAETHRRVMKLKNFDGIAAMIRAFSRDRGSPGFNCLPVPAIYASFVVTNDNIHETQDFLRFVEQDLGVDVALVRPLSELGNELGVVEDVRKIVPYESDVRDMIDAVREYMRDVPRKTEIRIAPETFRSFRPDPVGRVVMPLGFECRLLAPRRNDWSALSPDVVTVWNLNTVRINLPAIEGTLLRSRPVPVEPGRQLTFKVQVAVSGGPVRLLVEDSEHLLVAEVILADTGGRTIPLELQVQTGQASALSFVLLGQGRTAAVDVDFERVRTPAPYVSKEFCIPPSRRWEICVTGTEMKWNDSVLQLLSAKGGGPYLLKSYSIPCARDATIEIPIDVDVLHGSIEVGVLDEIGLYLQNFSFAPGRTTSHMFFNTGKNDSVQIVISAVPDRPVDATVRWIKPRLILENEDSSELPIRLPNPPEWAACVPDVRVDRRSDSVFLSWRGKGSPYLLKSNKVRCRPDRAANAQFAVEIEEGSLSVGILDGAGATWLSTHTVREGTHKIDLGFNPNGCNGVFFVISAIEGVPVRARIGLSGSELGQGLLNSKWTDFSTSPGISLAVAEPLSDAETQQSPNVPAEEASEVNDADGPNVGSFKLPMPNNGPTRASDEAALSAAAESLDEILVRANRFPKHDRGLPAVPKVLDRPLRRLKRTQRGPRYYCQKPWTDLQNFTVDGRMDVCCIATGSSQERYQLGNLTRQTFQEIWNGSTMQEFRRTVNGGNKLPPCARCPMSYAYQGFWFDPVYTQKEITIRVFAVLNKLRLSLLTGPAEKLCAFLIGRIVFKGFNKEKRWLS
jgi:radical SAM protein with 4Fe4S-binding SPASM domain